MWHYYRHLIILVIGFRCSTQAPHFTTPFMPHMTILGFMCPGLGKLIRSQALSHHAINKPHDTWPLSHSPSTTPFLYPISFATYHVIYSTYATMSAPTIAFVLISPVHTDKKGMNSIHPTSHISLCTLASCLHSYLALCLTLALCLLCFDYKSRCQTLWVTRVCLGLGLGQRDARRSYTNWLN